MSANFVDPSTLSLPSPQSDVPDSPRSEHLDNTAGPSRKRARTDMSAEERKEARAHRNRIAAQNSRDRRKAQFTALERRVAELEEENRQLRAGMTLSDLQHADIRRAQEQEREKARERENAELKERIKSLEKGWEAVMKVLAAQGLPTPSSSAESTTSSSNESTPPSSSNNTTTTFPVLVPSAPVFPITPSPSISGASIVLDTDESESTRHLARVDSRLSNLRSPIPPVLSLRRNSRRLPLPTTRRLHRQRTRQQWTPGSEKYSRALPSMRRRLLCLNVILSAKSRRSHPPRPPPPSRRR
ncbi:uncharacterized protein FOMMEDRAFT_140922 [Fomitiporia mediterranea MF3/22]|uniref:uncharacterized protein n=1 Tax=Fomitiporia mediterranea (strain MF3/22) TaxID=694068 RepID=UPI000440811F|nr:uncharacterized protein FOMMEDRAFT_140922 [Fomitiporia mediterranea MF3/22]EJD03224.1 hypothetical protein FOMMEDRAFT_140922 [Fomitiporia mediterranea MF3/22]